MAFDSSQWMSTVSLVASSLSAAGTAYLWIVKARRELPNLQIYPCSAGAEVNLGVYRGETRGLQFRTSVVVANYSLLPNAVIGVDVSMKRRDGSWEDISAPRAAGLPLNVPSMTTQKVELEWSVVLPALADAEARRGVEIPGAYLDHYYAEPRRLGIAVWALGEKEFRSIVPLTAGPSTARAIPFPRAA